MHLKSRSFSLFTGSIKSPQTRTVYIYSLDEFLKFSKIKEYDDILKLKPNQIQKLLENWVLFLKDNGRKGKTIKAKLSAVELFLEMNRVIFYKKILHKLIPSNDYIPGGEVPFTNEDIQRMLDATTKPRSKALLHFLASTGGRPASITDPVLRCKHIEDMTNGCKSVKIYDGSKEGYWAFLTPEATKALDNYLKWRKFNHEDLTPDSPVFANMEDASGKKNEYLSAKSARQIISNILKVTGIERTKNGYRYDKATVYGFRKRFNTILKIDNTVNSNIAEKLMGHKRGLDNSYLKPTREQCFHEFLKAIPELTISDEFRDKLKISKLEGEKSELDKLKEEVLKVKADLREEIDVRDTLDQIFVGGGDYEILEKLNPDMLTKRGYGLLLLNLGKIPNHFTIPKENLLMLANLYPHLAKAIGENGENIIEEGNVLKIKNKNKNP